MPRTTEQNREYMKVYRKTKAGKLPAFDRRAPDARIAELEEEVRHLKEELAKRLRGVVADDGFDEPLPDLPLRGFNTRPFTPVPKKGK